MFKRLKGSKKLKSLLFHRDNDILPDAESTKKLSVTVKARRRNFIIPQSLAWRGVVVGVSA